MKRPGTSTKYSRELINEAIVDYENSELGWDEIAEKHNIPKAVLQYHRRIKKGKEQNDGKED